MPWFNRIIKCLGGQIEETPTCTFDQINLRDNKNYKIMLYSDGVADLLGTDKVVEIAANSKDDQIARNLVHHAVNNKASTFSFFMFFFSFVSSFLFVLYYIDRPSLEKVLKR